MEHIARPVQVRVEIKKGSDFIEFGMRVPRQAFEGSEAAAAELPRAVADKFAEMLRHELDLPDPSGSPSLEIPRGLVVGGTPPRE